MDNTFEFFVNGLPRVIEGDYTIIAEKPTHFHVREIVQAGGTLKLHCPGCKVYGTWEAPAPEGYLGDPEFAIEESVEAVAAYLSGQECFWIFSLTFLTTFLALSIGSILIQ